MDNKKNDQQSGQNQSGTGKENPTLHEAGTAVADYGNVLGGSSNDNVEEGQNSKANDERSGNQETVGNP